MTDKRTKPIRYFGDIKYNDNTFTYSKAIPNTNTNLSTDIQRVKIKIEANSFENNVLDTSLNTLKSKWFINLTSDIIPHEVQCLLQLGENFSLPL